MCLFGIFEGSFRITVSSNLKAVSMFLYLVADVLDPPASILTILMRLCRLSVSFWELLYSDNFHYLRGSFRIFFFIILFVLHQVAHGGIGVPFRVGLSQLDLMLKSLCFYFRYRSMPIIPFNMLLPASVKELL